MSGGDLGKSSTDLEVGRRGEGKGEGGRGRKAEVPSSPLSMSLRFAGLCGVAVDRLGREVALSVGQSEQWKSSCVGRERRLK